MIRRSHKDTRKSAARFSRVREKAQRLRAKVKHSVLAFFERRQARLAWWQRAFRTPMAGGRWLFSQAKTLWAAFLALLGLKPKTQLLARGSSIGKPKSYRNTRGALVAENLEGRQLLAADLYVDDVAFGTPIVSGFAGSYEVTVDADSSNTLSTSDEVTWAGPDGNINTAADNVTNLTYGSSAFSAIQSAIATSASGDAVRVAPGTYVGDLTLNSGVNLIGAGAATTSIVGDLVGGGVTQIPPSCPGVPRLTRRR